MTVDFLNVGPKDGAKTVTLAKTKYYCCVLCAYFISYVYGIYGMHIHICMLRLYAYGMVIYRAGRFL